MTRTRRLSLWVAGSALLAALAGGAALLSARDPVGVPRGRAGRPTSSTVERRDFVRSLRLSGTVEAVESLTISTPRLAGQNNQSLVVTRLVPSGTTVRPGDLVVEFDRQEQLRNALDRRVELSDLEQQIKKKQAEERANRARDDSEIEVAESALARAELEMLKNEMLPKIEAEKNRQNLEEAKAKLAQLRTTYDLKRRAAEADLRILEIRRDRAADAMREAESNAEKMAIRSPIAGLVVIRTTWKGNTMADIQEGDEMRSGQPVLDIVNPSAMRVRAKVNQADINALKIGQRVVVGLDAYPDLHFEGRISQISPIGVTSMLSPKVRTFMVLVNVKGSHPNLMPDLTASLDVELERLPDALVVPRDALVRDGGRTLVRLRDGSQVEERVVTVAAMSAHEAAIASGLEEGQIVERGGWRGQP